MKKLALVACLVLFGPARVTCGGCRNPPHLSYGRASRFSRSQRVKVVVGLVVDDLHPRSGRAEIHPVTSIDPIQ